MNSLQSSNVEEGVASKDVLYIPSSDVLSSESIASDIALFSLLFCRSRSFNVVVVEPQISSRHQNIEREPVSKSPGLIGSSSTSVPGSRLLQSVVCDWLRSQGVTVTKKSQSQLSEILKDCILPVILDSWGNVCRCGLSTVLRRIVLRTAQSQSSEDLSALLGFRQVCLKTFADGNIWAKLVDFSLSNDVARQARKVNREVPEVKENMIPESLKTLEMNLSSPVSTFNLRHQEEAASRKEGRSGRKSREGSEAFVSHYKTEHVVVNKKTYRNAIRSFKRALANGEIPPETTFKSSEFFIPLESWKREMNKAARGNSLRNGTSENVEGRSDDTQRGSHREREKAVQPLDGSVSMTDVQQNVGEQHSKMENVDNRYETEEVVKSVASQFGGNELKISTTNAGEDDGGIVDSEISPNLHDTMNLLSLDTDSNDQASQVKVHSKLSSLSSEKAHLKHMFAVGSALTIVDIALFMPVHVFLELGIDNKVVLQNMIPYIINWYQRMWSLDSVKETAALCGVQELVFDCEIQLSIPDVKKPATVDYDHGKGKSRKARNHAVKRKLPSLLLKLEETIGFIDPEDVVTTGIDWSALPATVSPQHGEVPADRLLKKHQQIENLVTMVMAIVQDGDTIVDFCSGGGHVGIILAYLLPKCRVIMIEINDESVRRALQRVNTLQLTNAALYQSNIDYFHRHFDIGVSLHACGVATDIVIDKCLLSDASLVSSPCCYGSINTTESISYPRSKVFRDIPISSQELLLVAHAAEQTNWDFENENYKRGKLCMSIVDVDRLNYIKDHRYQVHLCSLTPATCSPKNNLLVGIAEKHQQTHCLSQFNGKQIGV